MEYNQIKWAFMAKQQGEGASGWKVTKRGHPDRGILAKPTNRILAEDRQDIKGGR